MNRTLARGSTEVYKVLDVVKYLSRVLVVAENKINLSAFCRQG
jgi:hypothetical protein